MRVLLFGWPIVYSMNKKIKTSTRAVMTIGNHDSLRANIRAVTCATRVKSTAARVAIKTLSKIIGSLRRSRLFFVLIGRDAIGIATLIQPAIGQ